MTTDADILTLTQWFSPAYPIGAFAYSHGLETAVQTGAITTSNDLLVWLGDVVEHGSGRNDSILLHAAYACDRAEELAEIDAAARAFAGSTERLRETDLQGSAFGKTTAAIWEGDALAHVNPVAVGHQAQRQALPAVLTAAMYLQAFTGNLVSAAVRLVPLGQTEGQAVLAALTPLCRKVAGETQNMGIDDLQSTAFMSDIMAMRHETLEHRIFRS